MTRRRVVVVGGGGSGIPFAVRRAEAGDADVLLLEAGPAWRSPAEAPAGLRAALGDVTSVALGIPGSPLASSYAAELFRGRDHVLGRGRLLGGSTAVNGGYFVRPHPDDFADWAAVGGEAWSFAACLPALRRLERDLDHPGSPVHGDAGPVPVSRPPQDADALVAFRRAAVETLGLAAVDDLNGGGPPGVGAVPMNAIDGRRISVAEAYLAEPVPALEVRGDSRVLRLRLAGDRVTGVEIATADGIRIEDADEVVLASGAVETPALLLRSGIGAAAELEDAGIPPVLDRAGVGAGLGDHPAVTVPWAPRPVATLGGRTAGWPAAAHLVSPGGPERGDVELLAGAIPDEHGRLGLRVALHLPRARGRVRLDGAGVRIDYRQFTDPADLPRLRAGVRGAVRLLTAPAFDGVRAEVDAPAPGAEDRVVDAWIIAHAGTSIHSSGTARMGDADEPGAVVDGAGLVHGIQGVRVADASILPSPPSRGTAAVAVLIGERIAELARGHAPA